MARPSPSAFGVLLRRHRLAAGLTQEELAERAGVSTRGVQDLERGTIAAPRADTLRLLATALGLDASGLAAIITAARPELSAPPATTDLPLTLPAMPVPATALIGREQEIATACAILRDGGDVPGSRLLTLTGPGGVGKTRVALSVATILASEDADAVAWVDLVPLRDPALLSAHLARAFGLPEHGDLTPEQSLTGALADRRLLLVLDNFEHLLPAAPSIAELLAEAPLVRVLVTSRARLQLRGERTLAIPPLGLPAEDDATDAPPAIAASDAVRMFVERASAARPAFTLDADNAAAVAGICRRIDGLPLAIELAATWIKVLSPAALLARLEHRLPLLESGPRDLPDRQRTMRDTVAWSLNLLTADEQAVFRRLSVFVGDFALEAAEAVAGYDATGDGTAARPAERVAVLDLIATLENQSLLRTVDQPGDALRFGLLETLREVGLEQLALNGEEEAVRQAHAAWYLALAQQAEGQLYGAEQGNWLARIDVEHANLRAALDWCATQAPATDTGLRIADALWSYWELRGSLREGRRWLEQLLAAAPQRTALRARVLTGAGALAFDAGDYDAAREYHDESLTIRRDLDDRRGIAVSLGNLGNVAHHQGAFSEARALYDETLGIMRALGERASESFVLNNLGQLALRQGEYAAARRAHEASLAISQEIGDSWSVAISLNNLGETALAAGDDAAAWTLLSEALATITPIGDTRIIAITTGNLGEVLYCRDDARAAGERFATSLVLSREVGDQQATASALANLATLMLDDGETATLWPYLDESLRIRLDMHDQFGIACCLVRCAALALALAQPQRAARLLDGARAALAAIGAALPPVDRLVAARVAAALHASDEAAQPEEPTTLAQLVVEARALGLLLV